MRQMDESLSKTTYDLRRPVGDRGTNQGGMREANERVVLTLLRRNANLAKADIARSTGLSAQTVARLIGALESDGLILHGEPQRGRIGQPSVPLSLNPRGAIFLGMKVGRRSVELIAADLVGNILAREKQVYDYPDFDHVLAFCSEATARIRNGLPAGLDSKIAGLGIAMPFHLWNWAQHIGVSDALMANWRTRDLQKEVAEQLQMPVFLQNDATAACSAELVFGQNPLPRNTLCFYLAFFIGGGLSLDHSVYTGSTGNAAGLGPLRVPDLQGRTRPLIELASLATLETDLQRAGCDTTLLWMEPDVWSFPNDVLDGWLEQAAHALAQAIQATQTLLDLDAILLDGWMPREYMQKLTQRVDDVLNDLDMTGMHRPDVVVGTVGADARVLGAASLPLSQRFLVS